MGYKVGDPMERECFSEGLMGGYFLLVVSEMVLSMNVFFDIRQDVWFDMFDGVMRGLHDTRCACSFGTVIGELRGYVLCGTFLLSLVKQSACLFFAAFPLLRPGSLFYFGSGKEFFCL